MKRKLFVISFMVLFAALFVSCADGIKGSMDSGSYPMGGQSSSGGNNSGSGNGGGNSSGSGGTTILSGTTWIQSGIDPSLGAGYQNPGTGNSSQGTVVFAASGNKVTSTIGSQRLVWDYRMTDSRTAEFSMGGSTYQSYVFVIDASDENKATFMYFVWTKQ